MAEFGQIAGTARKAPLWSGPSAGHLARGIVLLAGYGCLLAGGAVLGVWMVQLVDLDAVARMARPDFVIAAALVLFVLTSALPFVPGAEIGLMLMLCFGKPLVLPVYLCMVAALTLAFLAGRYVPGPVLSALFASLGLAKASRLVTGHGKNRMLRPNHEARRTWQGQLISIASRNRTLLLILLLNVPGNSIAGGGGGIAFGAGASGAYSTRRFLAAILVAIAPVPLIFYLTL
ncbi:MAG: hypothetical protein NXI27_11390 [Alphaproteobacteria bacterium]|nr:hypothetical protein [Alphaproteobacteria bacterium]